MVFHTYLNKLCKDAKNKKEEALKKFHPDLPGEANASVGPTSEVSRNTAFEEKVHQCNYWASMFNR
jgi:hypothetical protein